MNQQTVSFDRSEFDQSVVTRFERVAAALPAQIALAGNGECWTYEALDRRVNQVARVLVDRTSPGVGCIAYLVDHSPSMVICALAALKAAKAYLCIHPGLPVAGQREIVADAAPELLLTDKAHEPAARDIANQNCALLMIDDIDERAPSDTPAVPIESHSPAAVFYTSGSTGRPKGVIKSHRALLHRAWLCAKDDLVTPADRQSLLTYCSFASSEADVFGALLNGATLNLFDVGSRGLDSFGGWIDERQITVLHPPVVLFRRFLSSLEGTNQHPSVRLVALAGEAVLASDIEQWRCRFAPSCALRHRFSSTEAGHVAVARIEPGDAIAPGVVPAAHPVADKQLIIVDEQGSPVNAGAPGELWVRSAFLSDGYWRRLTETAADFSVDPRDPRQRVFRTGDLGRLHSDGRFEFLGRRDDQVKIRGYRVEMREVEHAFLKLPGVKEAAVIHERENGEARLVGFVVMKQTSRFRDDVLRAEMRSLLPQWKIPEQIHLVDTLPLTLTGKIDRQSLKASIKPEAITEHAAGLDPMTAQLTTIWEEILGRRGIGPDDHFFDLGGHSLLAVQLMQRIKQRIGRSLPISVLFDAPTPRQMATLIRASGATAAPSEKSGVLVALRTTGKQPPLFCVPAANGSALTYQPLARLLTGDHPIYALQFTSEVPEGIRVGRVEEIAQQFVEHVRRCWPRAPYRLCGHSFGAVIAFEMAQQLVASGAQVELLAMFDGRAPGSRRLLPLHRRLARHISRLRALGPGAAMVDITQRFRKRLRGSDSPGNAQPRKADSEDIPFMSRDEAREARVRAVRAYRPRPYPGATTLFRATVEPDWAAYNEPQPLNGWDVFCASIELHPIPGDHFSLLREPSLSVLAGALNDCLARTVGSD